jgi:DNA-binding transcriptional LysR family regulator
LLHDAKLGFAGAHMELRHLRYFIAVAEEEHFGHAAERLHIEQSPVSRTIQDLERELGTRLFDRTTRNIRITWAGQVFLDGVRKVFAMLDQTTADAKAAALGYHGHLRVRYKRNYIGRCIFISWNI